jgi:hypothetical protein
MRSELTEQEQKAASLTRLFESWPGTRLVLPFGLRGDKIVFQVEDRWREPLFEKLREWNWYPKHVNAQPHVTLGGMVSAALWEIEIPPDRPAVPDDRTIPGDIADNAELKGFRRLKL